MDLKNFFKKPNIIASISYLTWIGLIISFIINHKKKDKFISSHIKQSLFLIILGLIINALTVTSENIYIYILSGLWIWFIVSAFLNKKAYISFNKRKVVFGIIGAILGLPLSYYFQPGIIQTLMGGIGGYIKHFDEIVKAKDLIGNVITGVVVFAVIGFIIGYFMDNRNKHK